MKILVICGQGMSTSLMVQSMYKYAEEGDIIKAASAGELKDLIDDYDIILVGPQIRYKMKSIMKMALDHHRPAQLVDTVAYGRLNGKAVFEQAKKIYQEKGL